MRYAMLGLLCVVGCGGRPPDDGGKLDVWGLPAAKPAGPVADKEGAEWTHRELLAHLRARGLEFIDHGPPPVPISGVEPIVTLFAKKGETVLVILKATPKAAREAAGGGNASSHYWGRFVFFAVSRDGPPCRLLEEIRKAME